MIPLRLAEIAAVVGGRVEGDCAVTVTAPPVLDSRLAEPGSLFVAFAGQHADGHDHAGPAGAAGAVASTRLADPHRCPPWSSGRPRPLLQALAVDVVARLRDRLCVVGLTGSQEKTGTKDLLAAVLSSVAPTVATIGWLKQRAGVPFTMLRTDTTTRFLTLEMGARHVGDIAALTGMVAPDIAVVLNVGQAHLGEFGSRAAIGRTKGELVQGLAPGGTAVLNADDPRAVAMRSLTDGPVLTFGRAEHADVRVLDLALDRLARPSFTLRTADASAPVALPLVGAHQALNASAAAAAGLAAAYPSTWPRRPWPPPRCRSGGWSCATSPLARRWSTTPTTPTPTRLAPPWTRWRRSRAGRRIAVLGELLELGDESAAEHRAVGRYAASRADLVVTIGEAARSIAAGAGERAVALADNDAAVDWLRGHLAAGDVVLVKASRGARLDEVAAALA